MNGYFTRTYEQWRFTQTQNEYGTLIETETKVADLPGRAHPIRRTEDSFADTLADRVFWRFATVPTADLKPSDEIRFDGVTIRVQAAAPTSTGERIEAVCEEFE